MLYSEVTFCKTSTTDIHYCNHKEEWQSKLVSVLYGKANGMKKPRHLNNAQAPVIIKKEDSNLIPFVYWRKMHYLCIYSFSVPH
jgi:hypothetical protein